MAEHFEFSCGCRWPIVGPPLKPGGLPLLDIDNENLPFCSATWRMLAKGLTKGVFQLESPLGRQWTKRLRPESGEHMGGLVSLLRPGCLRAVDENGVSMTEHYCRRKNHEEVMEGVHPSIDWILKPTYGVLAYQEQAMEIAKVVAGFNLQEADMLRKAIGKKLPEEMRKCKAMFLDGAKKAAVVSDEQAERFFAWIEQSQRYSFNKCISGDTVICRSSTNHRMASSGYAVEHMYRIRNDVQYAKSHGHFQLHKKWKRLGHYGWGLSMCEDGRVRPNIIRNITPSGRREVYRVVLENDATICATTNHKFPTSLGEMTLGEIMNRRQRWCVVSLYVCGSYEKSNGCLYKYSHMTREQVRVDNKKAVNNCFRAANHAYTNGSFTDFVTNGKVIPRVCHDCGKTKGHLELHHINGDRTNSKLDNLTRLCASCHKLREYAAGRVRKGEKGYLSLEVAIRDIVYDGEVETYDVEMDGPNHNFVVDSNIITCNSHAAAYGLTGYDCAYLKCHVPLSFFTAWLLYASENADPTVEVYALVGEAKLFNIAVLPPTLDPPEYSQGHVYTDGEAIRFGMQDIKGVGEKQAIAARVAVNVAKEMLGKPCDRWTWMEFLTRCAMNLPAALTVKLIDVGALHWLPMTRAAQRFEFGIWEELTYLEKCWIIEHSGAAESLRCAIDKAAWPKKEGGACATKTRVTKLRSIAALLEKPPVDLTDKPDNIAWLEQELLGVSLTCSRIDAYKLDDVNTTCREFMMGRTGYMVFGVQIDDVREVKTKKGDLMAFITMSDNSASLADVIAFPEAWAANKQLLFAGNTVILRGERDRKKVSLLVQEVAQMQR